MGKILYAAVIIIVIVLLLTWVEDVMNQAGVGTGPVPQPTVVAGQPTAPGGGPSTKIEFTKVANVSRVTIENFKESPGDIVEMVIRGYSRNDVAGFLDQALTNGVVKDIFHEDVKYWKTLEQGRQVHYAYYKFRAYL